MSAVKISAVIITFNEENNIDRCLLSLKDVADEVVVVDSYSTDSTPEIAKNYRARLITQSFLGFTEQKNFALDKAEYDHVLSLDADEVLSEELQNEILKIKSDWKADGYALNRLNNYCGKWIKHSGWYPEYKLRLWDRRKGRWIGGLVHESVKIDSPNVERLKGDLLHYSYTSINQHIQQIIKYSDLGAEDLMVRNKKVYPAIHLWLYPIYTFFNKYLLKQGIRDGYYGFIIAYLSAFGKFLKYAKAWDKYKRNRNKV
ncbi:MAG: glycosyltransferase family 2 protein [Candidatus Cyclobacteriaceae bacterium M2_1C_046]